MQRTPHRKTQGGFTLIVVIVFVAMLASVGLSLLQLVKLDLALIGESRRNIEARDAAEGGLMETLNSTALPGQLPSLNGTMTTNLTPPTTSPFQTNWKRYTGQINMLRTVPMSESSVYWTRALVYEVQVGAEYSARQDFTSASDAAVRAASEFYKIGTFQPGVILPQNHYR